MSGAASLLVVGDVHGQWDAVDEAFAAAARPDALVFVGDLGDEDTALVARLAALPLETAVLLGNHDAWWAARGRGLERVREQLRLLGDRHLAWSARPLAAGAYALVGGRPFSWGGGWSRLAGFYRELFGVEGDEASAERVVAAARTVPGATLVVVGHNGPAGLGEGRDAIFGCDFRSPHVDFGDRDLRLALDRLRAEGRRVAACVAGHMHEELRGGGRRQRVARADGCVHLNAAVVPRHRRDGGGTRRHFLRLELEAGALRAAADLWVDDGARVVASEALVGAPG